MLIRNIENGCYCFSLNSEQTSEIIPIKDWLLSDGAIYYEPLQSLVDNGYGKKCDYSFIIPFVNIYELDSIELEMLEFPLQYPFEIYIQADGLITKQDFKYDISYCNFAPSGTRFIVNSLSGSILNLDIQNYLLSKEQYRLISAIEEFNNLPAEHKKANANLSCFANIKELSITSASTLDSSLVDKNVILPKRVKINIDYRGDVLDVVPTIDGEYGEKFSYTFDRYNEVRDNYPITQADGGKTHIVVSKEQKEELQKIKKQYRRVSDPKLIKAIVDSPESFFDTEAIDISELYSDRVIKIGLYEPKFYSFISPYKSQWIPCYKVVDRTNGTSNLSFRNYQELADFKNAINESQERGEVYTEFRGTQLSIADAFKIEADARKQLEAKQKVEDKGEDSLEEVKKRREVLIIEENTDELGFSEDVRQLQCDQPLKLLSNKYLNPNISLKSHQEQGIAWLQHLLMLNSKGCLLADDMGLGKTLQLLYLIDWHSRERNNENKPYLIIAPVSLLENWEQEYERFFTAPRLFVQRISGAPRLLDKEFITNMSEKKILLTSYETMRSGQLNFGAIDFAIIVLDEAQKIKTPGTLVTNAAKALKGDFKVAMTGTPVENSFIDLWCITDFSIPGLLGNAKAFAQKYHNSLKKKGVNVVALGNEIRENIGNYILRRLKSDIADQLPKKLIQYSKTSMPKEQLERYKIAINMGLNDNDSTDGSQGNMLTQIMNIRAIVDHPYLLDNNFDNCSCDDIIESSAKLLSTFKILNSIKQAGEKAIIFTERRDMQRLLRQTIYYKFDISPRIINGDTATVAGTKNLSRQQTIDFFQSQYGFNVIIMSPLSAGMGLNVVGANHVIHYTRHWNPAKENQATDRAYRIGQTKDVTVYYPMAISNEFDSFDIVLDKMLQSKSQLATSTLYPSDMIEVDKQELFNSLFDKRQEVDITPLTMTDVDNLNGYLFEAFTALYYQKQGYNVVLTTRSGDKGVDVLVFSDSCNYAIQCKHSKNNVGRECVSEVVAGTRYYETKYSCLFTAVVFTNSFYTVQALEIASVNNVITIDRGMIPNFIETYKVSKFDIYMIEDKREN